MSIGHRLPSGLVAGLFHENLQVAEQSQAAAKDVEQVLAQFLSLQQRLSQGKGIEMPQEEIANKALVTINFHPDFPFVFGELFFPKLVEQLVEACTSSKNPTIFQNPWSFPGSKAGKTVRWCRNLKPGRCWTDACNQYWIGPWAWRMSGRQGDQTP